MILFEGQKMQGNEQKKGQKAKARGHIIQEKSHRKKMILKNCTSENLSHSATHFALRQCSPKEHIKGTFSRMHIQYMLYSKLLLGNCAKSPAQKMCWRISDYAEMNKKG